MNIHEYTNNLIESLIINTYKNNGINSIYEFEEGALRLAREYAYGLRDFNVKCQSDIIGNSYMLVCFRYYQGNPPISFAKWCSEICCNLNKSYIIHDI